MAPEMISRGRVWAFSSLLVLVPLGLYSKFYAGPAASWVNNSLSGVFYEVFWCLLIFLVFEDVRPSMICSLVLILTCILEFLQLWHHPFLEWLRSRFIGRAVLGTTFMWSDFPYYFLGCGIGWFWLRRLRGLQAWPRAGSARPRR